MEVAGGLWMFTPNRNFSGGSRREQKPIMSLQGDLIYTLCPRMWVSVTGSHAARGYRAVTVSGVRYYTVGGVYYKPQIYGGSTVYVVAHP